MFITWGRGGVDFEPKNRGLRTAIEVFPVHVYPKRGAEGGGTRLRGVEGKNKKGRLEKSPLGGEKVRKKKLLLLGGGGRGGESRGGGLGWGNLRCLLKEALGRISIDDLAK